MHIIRIFYFQADEQYKDAPSARSVLVPLSPSPIALTHRVSFPLVSLSARHIEQGQQQQPDGDRGGGGGLHVESPSRRRSPLTEEPRRRTTTASAPSQLSSGSLASFPPAAPKSLPHTCHGKPSEWMTVCLVGWSSPVTSLRL